MKSLRLKKLIITRLIGLIVVVSLVGLVIVAGRFVQGIRIQLAERQLVLEESLNNAVHRAAVADKLVQYEPEIKRVTDTVPWRDEIGQVIEMVELEAKKWGVAVLVPKINEEPKFDESGVPVPQTGPTRLIRLKVEATGNPLALMNFLHSLENLPYLINPLSFVLDNEDESVNTVGPAALAPALSGSKEEREQKTVQQSSLKADFLLTVRVEELK